MCRDSAHVLCDLRMELSANNRQEIKAHRDALKEEYGDEILSVKERQMGLTFPL